MWPWWECLSRPRDCSDQLRDSCRHLRCAQSSARRSRTPVASGTALSTAYQIIFVLAALAALLPWLLLFRESCGTAIYPVQRGFLTPGFEFLKGNPSFVTYLHSLWSHVFFERPLYNLPIFVLAALLPSAGNDRIARAASAGAILGFCAVVYAGGAFDPFNNSRYYFSFITSFGLIMVLTVGRTRTVANEITMDVRDIVIVVGVLGSLAIGRAEVAGYYKNLLEVAERGHRDAAIDARASQAKTTAYRDLQDHMTAGAKAVMMVDEPFRFDLRRNEMFSLDVGGGMGPPPGYPAFAGTEALRSYLISNGVRYVVHVDFTRSAELYVRTSWESHLSKTGFFLQIQAPFMLDAMKSIGRARPHSPCRLFERRDERCRLAHFARAIAGFVAFHPSVSLDPRPGTPNRSVRCLTGRPMSSVLRLGHRKGQFRLVVRRVPTQIGVVVGVGGEPVAPDASKPPRFVLGGGADVRVGAARHARGLRGA